MPSIQDGPRSPLFRPLSLPGGFSLSQLAGAGVSEMMAASATYAPSGECTSWGMPFRVGKVALVKDKPVSVRIPALKTLWLVFMHTSDARPPERGKAGFISPMRGVGHLGEHAADYVIVYADGTEHRTAILRRHQIGMFQLPWGENCFEAVGHRKPQSFRAAHEQLRAGWGESQTRVTACDSAPWVNWLWAWMNPFRAKAIVGFRFEPVSGVVVVSAVTAGKVAETPLRWETRRKAILTLPKGMVFDPTLDDKGLLKQIQLDMGQVISATPRPVYPNGDWARTYNNRVPQISSNEVLLEYAAHPEARFHLPGGRTVPAAKLPDGKRTGGLQPVAPATQRVRVRVIGKHSRSPVAVKLHVHGEAGEYLAPVDRNRIPNTAWFEDYSVDFSNQNIHPCTYIHGETTIDLPLGRVFVEVSKGFEIRPVRRVVRVGRGTEEIVIEIEKALPWRESGWVSADTHVHFLSPPSALLEGAGEGVNVVNLLASQWGELMTNVGDFDGKTTFGSKEAGGSGEYLVRVGTENRQHVLGHISLLGYSGHIIAPMTTGGPDESALGDPIGALLTEWAVQCKKQGGIVVLPHFPSPRLENAATIVSGNVDGAEMTAWGNLYGGIDPYSLSDWYRFLNCGYFVAAVGGTDKMQASTAVGAVRTYARIDPEHEFTYQNWMNAIRLGNTFVTYGPLLEFSVDGKDPGRKISMSAGGGTVGVSWKVASVTVPISKVELIVNGEIRESKTVSSEGAEGSWSVRLGKSSWLALLVRGHYRDKPEIIAAHSSPVMIEVEGSPFIAAADAVTILEQIEGALAYLDTVGTRAETRAYKRMRLVLVMAHRGLHNRMHEAGCYHDHTPVRRHVEHS